MACLFYDWKRINRHNRTVPANPVWQELFPLKKVHVGAHTYGGLHVVPYNNTDGELYIGSYCSIAREVKFLLGGNHDYKRISTYPFKQIVEWEGSSFSKGDIRIEDDVWIGENTLVLSGVTIGQGAIVAAGSVVTHDIEPYEIVGGNPIHHIKYRFSKEIVDNLIRIDYNKITEDTILRFSNLFKEQLTKKTVEEIMLKLPLKAIK